MKENNGYNEGRYVRKEKTPEQARSALMKQCSRSERSSSDALRLMKSWGLSEQDTEKVLADLVSMKFIDDRRFAEAFVRDKVNFSGWGEFKIRTALRQKGIEASVIEEMIAVYASGNGNGRLESLMLKKMSRTKAKDRFDLKVKVVRYFVGQGYRYDEVTDTAAKLFRDVEQD